MLLSPNPNSGGTVGTTMNGGVAKKVRLFQPSTSKNRNCSELPLSSQRCTAMSGPAAQGVPKSRVLSSGSPVMAFARSTLDLDVRASITAPACTDHCGHKQQASQLSATVWQPGAVVRGGRSAASAPA